mmetsp:Transcript_15617/g.16362  ORF Transcript_15617/g.16362 Transcript_15617/m.16362 type:complete len:196 (-) Transcript_15617:122-709(-)
MAEISLQALNYLLKASSKETVEKILNLVFISRYDTSKTVTPTIKSLLDLEEESQAEELYQALLICVKCVLGSGELSDLAELFKESGNEVNSKLKSLVGQIITNRLEVWKDAAASSRVSLPKYLDVDWTLNIQKSSSEVVHMNIPSLLVELSLEPTPETTDAPPSVDKISFELSREALETVLDGLGRIRDQLGAMG